MRALLAGLIIALLLAPGAAATPVVIVGQECTREETFEEHRLPKPGFTYERIETCDNGVIVDDREGTRVLVGTRSVDRLHCEDAAPCEQTRTERTGVFADTPLAGAHVWLP